MGSPCSRPCCEEEKNNKPEVVHVAEGVLTDELDEHEMEAQLSESEMEAKCANLGVSLSSANFDVDQPLKLMRSRCMQFRDLDDDDELFVKKPALRHLKSRTSSLNCNRERTFRPSRARHRASFDMNSTGSAAFFSDSTKPSYASFHRNGSKAWAGAGSAQSEMSAHNMLSSGTTSATVQSVGTALTLNYSFSGDRPEDSIQEEPEDEPRSNFTGIWRCIETWGLEQFLKTVGIGFIQRKAAMSAPWPWWTFEVNDDGTRIHFINHGPLGEVDEHIDTTGTPYASRDGKKQPLQNRAYWEAETLIIDRTGPQGTFRESRTIDTTDILLFCLELTNGEHTGIKWGRKFQRGDAEFYGE